MLLDESRLITAGWPRKKSGECSIVTESEYRENLPRPVFSDCDERFVDPISPWRSFSATCSPDVSMVSAEAELPHLCR